MNGSTGKSTVNSSPEPAPRRLPEGYYVDNFEVVLRTVVERYGDLLSGDEQAFLAGFEQLSIDARRLYVRLVSRRGPVFRRDRIVYPEVACLTAAIGELEAVGLADRAAETDTQELLALLLRAEILETAASLAVDGLPSTVRKDELIAVLVERVSPETLRSAVEERVDPVRILQLERVLTFRLLFFGNLSQDWTDFVLRDIGVVRYESYELRRESRLFPTRQAVDDYLLLRQSRRALRSCVAAGGVEPAVELARSVLAGADRWHARARPQADHILNEVGRALERRGEDRAALELYAGATAPPARERRARVLARLGSVAQALELCEEIGADPRDETEVDFARRFSHRLRRMRGEPLRPRARRRRPGREILVEKREDMAVEQLALGALAGEGRRGFFAENWLWKSLFGLAFWNIIFAPVAGAFQHPFQLGPLDLDSPGFRAARSGAVDRRLGELRDDPRPGPKLLAVYDEKRDIANRLVTWFEGLRPDLALALSRLEGPHLALVFDRLSRDLWRYRRGFPDLFVLRDEQPGFELYEVKAPGDQLRPEQKAWIDYLNDGGIPTSILHLIWPS